MVIFTSKPLHIFLTYFIIFQCCPPIYSNHTVIRTSQPSNISSGGGGHLMMHLSHSFFSSHTTVFYWHPLLPYSLLCTCLALSLHLITGLPTVSWHYHLFTISQKSFHHPCITHTQIMTLLIWPLLLYFQVLHHAKILKFMHSCVELYF